MIENEKRQKSTVNAATRKRQDKSLDWRGDCQSLGLERLVTQSSLHATRSSQDMTMRGQGEMPQED